MDNVVSIFKKTNKIDNVIDLFGEEKDVFSDVIEKNKKNKERVEKERSQHNKKIAMRLKK